MDVENVPSSHNQAENDLRMTKVQKKFQVFSVHMVEPKSFSASVDICPRGERKNITVGCLALIV